MGSAPFTLTRRSFLSQRRRLNIWRVPRQGPVGQHRHEFFEIVVVLSGSGVHVTGNYRHRLEAGDVFVLNPRRTHGYEDCHSLNIANILVRDDVLRRIGRAFHELPGYHALFRLESLRWKQSEYTSRLHLHAAELERVNQWMLRMEEEVRRGARAVVLLQEACLALIIDSLCRLYTRKNLRARTSSTIDHPAHLSSLLSWIEQRLDRPLRVADLAAQAGMSVRTFHRVFHATLQTTPQAYLAEARMHRAADMLAGATSVRTIAEIALACGFDDSNYFTRCFRQFSGRSPRDYRTMKARQA